jgi:uncharacterized membrane-anchored protein
LALAVVTGLVIHKERILAAGQPVFLELRPLDPRSLMQGDYMALDYAIERDVHPSERSGKLVVELDENNVGTLVGEWSGAELGPRQQLIEYRMIKRRLLTDVRIGAETFMFAEGEADRYANARYGELRVSARGEALLVGLADEHLRPL